MPVLESWMLVLPLCTALGCLFGSFTFRHFALGSSAILFAGMAAGAAGAQMPPAIRELGLALFIYSVGSETGGGFLAVLARRGPKLAAVCLATVTAGFAAALLCGLCFGLPPAGIAGLFGGALTSTPALATAMDGLDPAGTVLLTASYGLAYPAGIIGVVVFVRIAARLEGVDVKAEEDALNAQDADPLPARKDGGANPRGTPAPSAGTSPLPVLLVIGAGYALGQLPLPLPGQSSVSLGSAGGILLCAILAAGKGHAGKLPLLPSPQMRLFLRDFASRIYHVHMKDVKVKLDGRSGILGSHIEFGDRSRGWNFVSLGHGDVDFDGIIRELNQMGYDGPLSVEWEDSGMERTFGAAEAFEFTKKINFSPSDVSFDAALKVE